MSRFGGPFNGHHSPYICVVGWSGKKGEPQPQPGKTQRGAWRTRGESVDEQGCLQKELAVMVVADWPLCIIWPLCRPGNRACAVGIPQDPICRPLLGLFPPGGLYVVCSKSWSGPSLHFQRPPTHQTGTRDVSQSVSQFSSIQIKGMHTQGM